MKEQDGEKIEGHRLERSRIDIETQSRRVIFIREDEGPHYLLYGVRPWLATHDYCGRYYLFKVEPLARGFYWVDKVLVSHRPGARWRAFRRELVDQARSLTEGAAESKAQNRDES